MFVFMGEQVVFCVTLSFDKIDTKTLCYLQRATWSETIYTNGCFKEFEELLSGLLPTLAGIGLGIVVLEVWHTQKCTHTHTHTHTHTCTHTHTNTHTNFLNRNNFKKPGTHLAE